MYKRTSPHEWDFGVSVSFAAASPILDLAASAVFVGGEFALGDSVRETYAQSAPKDTYPGDSRPGDHSMCNRTGPSDSEREFGDTYFVRGCAHRRGEGGARHNTRNR